VNARITLIALLLAGCAATPSVVTKTDTTRDRPADHTVRREQDSPKPVTVDSDKIERHDTARLIVFTGTVVARLKSSVQYADRMDVYVYEKSDRIRRIVSTGNVRIVTRDPGEARARRADYHDAAQTVVLRGEVRVWQGGRIVRGECLVIELRWGEIAPCPGVDELPGAAELHTQAPSELERASAPPAAG